MTDLEKFEVERFARLLDLAADGPKERGLRLARSSAVEIVSTTSNAVSARVKGTSRYRVEIRTEGSGSWRCTCPAAADGSFCKHCVAVVSVLVGAKSESTEQHHDPDSKLVTEYVRSLDAVKLADLVIGQAEVDDGLAHRLLAEATAEIGETIDVGEWKKRLTAAFRGRGGSIDWRHAAEWARGVHDMLDTLWSFLGAGHAVEVAKLAEHAHHRNESAVNRVDDSGGEIVEIMRAIADIHLAACESGAYPPKKLGKRLAELELNAALDTFHRSAVTYAEILGDDGLATYGAVVEKALSGRPVAEVRWGVGFRLREARTAHALATRNVDQLIDMMDPDSKSVRQYVELINQLVECDRLDEAAEWCDLGLEACERSVDVSDLRHMRASLTLQLGGEAHEVEAMFWEAFTRRPSSRSAAELIASSHDGPSMRTRVIEWIEEAVADAQRHGVAERDSFRHRGSSNAPLGAIGAPSALVGWTPGAMGRAGFAAAIGVLLDLDEFDRAWAVAMEFGAGKQEWAELTSVRASEHPNDALDWAFVLAEIEIDHRDRRHYKRAVKLLQTAQHRIVESGAAADELDARFQAGVAAILAEHANKPSLIDEFNKAGWKPRL